MSDRSRPLRAVAKLIVAVLAALVAGYILSFLLELAWVLLTGTGSPLAVSGLAFIVGAGAFLYRRYPVLRHPRRIKEATSVEPPQDAAPGTTPVFASSPVPQAAERNQPRPRNVRTILILVLLVVSAPLALHVAVLLLQDDAPSTMTTTAPTLSPMTTTSPTTTNSSTTESDLDAFRSAIQPLWEAEQEFEEVGNPFHPFSVAKGLGDPLKFLVEDRALWASASSLVEVDQLLSEYDLSWSWSEDGRIFNEDTGEFEDFWETKRQRRQEEARKAEAALSKITELLTQASALHADLEPGQAAMVQELRAGVEVEIQAMRSFLEADEAKDTPLDERLLALAKLSHLLDQGASFGECAAVIDDELLPAFDNSIAAAKNARESAHAFIQARRTTLRIRESIFAVVGEPESVYPLPLLLDAFLKVYEQ